MTHLEQCRAVSAPVSLRGVGWPRLPPRSSGVQLPGNPEVARLACWRFRVAVLLMQPLEGARTSA